METVTIISDIKSQIADIVVERLKTYFGDQSIYAVIPVGAEHPSIVVDESVPVKVLLKMTYFSIGLVSGLENTEQYRQTPRENSFTAGYRKGFIEGFEKGVEIERLPDTTPGH